MRGRVKVYQENDSLIPFTYIFITLLHILGTQVNREKQSRKIFYSLFDWESSPDVDLGYLGVFFGVLEHQMTSDFHHEFFPSIILHNIYMWTSTAQIQSLFLFKSFFLVSNGSLTEICKSWMAVKLFKWKEYPLGNDLMMQLLSHYWKRK